MKIFRPCDATFQKIMYKSSADKVPHSYCPVTINLHCVRFELHGEPGRWHCISLGMVSCNIPQYRTGGTETAVVACEHEAHWQGKQGQRVFT